MTTATGITRRRAAGFALTGAAIVSLPWTARRGLAAEPIKIGMPLALTGPLGSVGQQLKRGGEAWAKAQNAKGGLLGRQIRLLIEDTAGNPADCVRKAQEMVERDGCNIFTGITLSSEALAVAPKLEEWKAIFVSSDNGDGKLTAGALVPNFFRANISAPMGARAVSLFLRQSEYHKFYAIAMDYAWGHSSVGVFESEIKRAKKDFLGSVYSPIGTKDFSTYITKIRQSGAEALYIVMAGDDFNAFLSQAAQYKLPEKVQMLTEQLELSLLRAVGDASLGLVGSTRYCFTIDTPKNKEFVAMWQKEHGVVPDTFEGEQWQALQVLAAGIEKANSTDTKPLHDALETIAVDDIKGRVAMRQCDHQAVQNGFMVKVVKQDGFAHPVPQLIASYPGEQTTPPCNKETFEN